MKDWLNIHALADGELDAAERTSVEAEIASNPTCQAELGAIRRLKSTISSKAIQHHSAASWNACKERLVELQKRRQVETLVGKYAWGMTSIFLAAILGASFLNQLSHRQDLGTGDVASIVSGLAPLSSSRNQPEDMKSWIKNSPVKLDLGDLQVIEGRSFICKERVVDRLLLSDGRGTFVLLIVRGTEPIEGSEPMTYPGEYSAVRMEGGNGVLWSDSGYTLGLVGPRPMEEMLSVAESVRLRR